MDRRKLKRPKPPQCSADHVWGYFEPYALSMVKRCKHCPAMLTKKEFLEKKMLTNVVRVKNPIHIPVSHIDLFLF